MGIPNRIFTETYKVFRYSSDAAPNAIGEMPKLDENDTTNLVYVANIKAHVNTGDFLEPDVRGTQKNYGQDLSSVWIGWFECPDTDIYDLKVGDYLKSETDSERQFTIHFLDKMPGGIKGHHYEAVLETTEVFRNG